MIDFFRKVFSVLAAIVIVVVTFSVGALFTVISAVGGILLTALGFGALIAMSIYGAITGDKPSKGDH